MALARILVDGYSLLHACPDLARGRAPHSAAARDELIHWLTQYQDAAGTPVTVIFDGSRPRGERPGPETPTAIEVLYSRRGQTADDIIERVTHRMKPYGETLVVTNDRLERDTVMAVGGMACGCQNFFEQVESAIGQTTQEVEKRNRKEWKGFRKEFPRRG